MKIIYKNEKKLTDIFWYTPETPSAYLIKIIRTFLLYVLSFVNGVPTILCRLNHEHIIYFSFQNVNIFTDI